jgi:hypothetical protein
MKGLIEDAFPERGVIIMKKGRKLFSQFCNFCWVAVPSRSEKPVGCLDLFRYAF